MRFPPNPSQCLKIFILFKLRFTDNNSHFLQIVLALVAAWGWLPQSRRPAQFAIVSQAVLKVESRVFLFMILESFIGGLIQLCFFAQTDRLLYRDHPQHMRSRETVSPVLDTIPWDSENFSDNLYLLHLCQQFKTAWKLQCCIEVTISFSKF